MLENRGTSCDEFKIKTIMVVRDIKARDKDQYEITISTTRMDVPSKTETKNVKTCCKKAKSKNVKSIILQYTLILQNKL